MTARFMSEPPWGRSPRARGSHAGQRALHIPDGSIPACAGEPRTKPPPPSLRRVDPRVRGGAPGMELAPAEDTGRSPRARGSLLVAVLEKGLPRSIPACAGEPSPGFARSPSPGVDPRVRGGAKLFGRGLQGYAGRSPRARGSLAHGGAPRVPSRSIPACAGEPTSRCRLRRRRRVDPRVRGGAGLSARGEVVHPGRSPRARGSPRQRVFHDLLQGSIPACAGEPTTPSRARPTSRVDPRVRGGACTARRWTKTRHGRSPRARGSRHAGAGDPL